MSKFWRGIGLIVAAAAAPFYIPAAILLSDAWGAEPGTQICWQNPTQNIDGSALVDLKSVSVYWSASSPPSGCVVPACWPGLQSKTILTDKEGATECTQIGLPPGKNYLAATASSASGGMSALSNVVTKTGPGIIPIPPVVPLDPICPSCTRSTAEVLIGSTGKPITLRWEPGELGIEVEVRKYPGGARVASKTIPARQGEWVWTPARPGLYYVSSRTCSGQNCTEWPGPSQQSLIFYIELPAPTGGGIE